MPSYIRRFQGGAAEWNSLIAGLPGTHLLQTWEWAQIKQAHGWEPLPLTWDSSAAPEVVARPAGDAGLAAPAAAAMVLKRRILRRGWAAHLCLLYIPKGPLLDWRNVTLRNCVLDDLESLARKEHAIFLKLDPDVLLGTGLPGETPAGEDACGQIVASELRQRGWTFSRDQIQFRNTVLVDLLPSEEDILGRMKQKTRYNVRLAEKKGVVVRTGTSSDLPLLYRMYAETSERDGFVIRNETYYTTVWETFMRPSAAVDQPSAEPLIAEVDGRVIAAIVVFYFADRAYYLYGMSREVHREMMPNHLLQWEAMKRAKRRGCHYYDLWGAPDVFSEMDSMWGVFRFKEGLGGDVVRTLGAWDLPVARFWYPIYTRIVPLVLGMMRARGMERNRQDLAAA
jgi:peptidoglycan pentaglycine glycine transferase (the first glycine)